jgi:hypothetical protein
VSQKWRNTCSSGCEKIKLGEQAISEVLVGDTDPESGAEASNVEDEFYELKKRRRRRRNNKPQHKKTSHKLEQVAQDYQPGYRLKEGHQYPSFCRSSKTCDKR